MCAEHLPLEALHPLQRDIISDRLWANLKTGNIYEVTCMHVMDCTNARAGNRMVAYHPLGCSNEPYIRDYDEFMEKFIPVVA